jgi:alkylhydroperoxidase family enzyme
MEHPPLAPRLSKPPRRIAERLSALIDAVVSAAGQLPVERRAAATGEPLPGPMGVFADKVRRRAYAVTDEDIDVLRQLGLNEDAIFELTIASAVGEASARLQAGLRAMGRDA